MRDAECGLRYKQPAEPVLSSVNAASGGVDRGSIPSMHDEVSGVRGVRDVCQWFKQLSTARLRMAHSFNRVGSAPRFVF